MSLPSSAVEASNSHWWALPREGRGRARAQDHERPFSQGWGTKPAFFALLPIRCSSEWRPKGFTGLSGRGPGFSVETPRSNGPEPYLTRVFGTRFE